jgi:hypothetical protein
MPRGRVPQDVLSRPRDTRRREAETVTVSDTGQLAGPELPSGVLTTDEAWHPRTVAFWEELRKHPLMQNEPGLSWQYAIDIARLHHQMWQHDQFQLAAEIRLRVAKFALTPEDRQRLKVRIAQPVNPAPSGPGSVSDIASRRDRLTT